MGQTCCSEDGGRFNQPFVNQHSMPPGTISWNPYLSPDLKVKYTPTEQPVIRNEYVRMKLAQLGKY